MCIGGVDQLSTQKLLKRQKRKAEEARRMLKFNKMSDENAENNQPMR